MKACQDVLRELQNLVPRVGKAEIQSTSILEKLQNLFPDRVIVTAIACRGTDRTMGPPQHLSKDMAPYRKTFMVFRPSGEIKYEREWEKLGHSFQSTTHPTGTSV